MNVYKAISNLKTKYEDNPEITAALTELNLIHIEHLTQIKASLLKRGSVSEQEG